MSISSSKKLLHQAPEAGKVFLLTAEECSADRKQVIACNIPTVSLHFLSREQSYHHTSHEHNESEVKVYHLQVYQTSEAPTFSLSRTTAAVEASFQSQLSHFSLLSSGANFRPHPVPSLKGDCCLMEDWEGDGMSSLPLGGISLIKMK